MHFFFQFSASTKAVHIYMKPSIRLIGVYLAENIRRFIFNGIIEGTKSMDEKNFNMKTGSRKNHDICIMLTVKIIRSDTISIHIVVKDLLVIIHRSVCAYCASGLFTTKITLCLCPLTILNTNISLNFSKLLTVIRTVDRSISSNI